MKNKNDDEKIFDANASSLQIIISGPGECIGSSHAVYSSFNSLLDITVSGLSSDELNYMS